MADTQALEQRFHQHLLDLYYEIGAKSKTPGTKAYWPRRFNRKVTNDGGLPTARWYLARRDPEAGFHTLVKLGLPELSLEVAVLQEPWRALFTSDQLATARRRLEAERVHLRKVGDDQFAERLEQVLSQLARQPPK